MMLNEADTRQLKAHEVGWTKEQKHIVAYLGDIHQKLSIAKISGGDKKENRKIERISF